MDMWGPTQMEGRVFLNDAAAMRGNKVGEGFGSQHEHLLKLYTIVYIRVKIIYACIYICVYIYICINICLWAIDCLLIAHWTLLEPIGSHWPVGGISTRIPYINYVALALIAALGPQGEGEGRQS